MPNLRILGKNRKNYDTIINRLIEFYQAHRTSNLIFSHLLVLRQSVESLTLNGAFAPGLRGLTPQSCEHQRPGRFSGTA